MKSNTLKHGFYPLVLSLAMGLGSAQAASDMVVVGYGGAGQKAQDVAFFQPFAAVDQSKVIQSEYNGEMAKIKVMVDTGNVDWDVVQIEGPDLMRGCEEGMYERLDWTRLGHADQLIPDAAQECGSAALVWSVAIAYDTDKLAQAPTSWADFWDVKKTPGKRGLRKRAVYNLEFALLADGVKVEDVYKVLEHPAGCGPGIRQTHRTQALHPVVGGRRATAAMADRRRCGDDLDLQRAHCRRRAEEAATSVWSGPAACMAWITGRSSRARDMSIRPSASSPSPTSRMPRSSTSSRSPTARPTSRPPRRLDDKLAQWVPTAPQNLKGALSMNVGVLGRSWRRTGRALQRLGQQIISEWLDVSKRPALLSAQPNCLENPHR